jgi:hypothetical protein
VPKSAYVNDLFTKYDDMTKTTATMMVITGVGGRERERESEREREEIVEEEGLGRMHAWSGL